MFNCEDDPNQMETCQILAEHIAENEMSGCSDLAGTLFLAEQLPCLKKPAHSRVDFAKVRATW